MALPRTEALLDAITAAKIMNRSREGFDVAPKIAGLRVVLDETIPVGEVYVLSDEDYLEHERRKLQAGDA